MNIPNLLSGIITLWLLPWLLIAFWVWANMTRGRTAEWADVLFCLDLVLLFLDSVKQPAEWLVKHRLGRFVSWIVLTLSALVGTLYASLPLTDDPTFPLTWLFEFLHWPPQFLLIPQELKIEVARAYSLGIDTQPSALLRILPFGLIVWFISLVIAVAARAVFSSIQSQFAPRFNLLRTRWSYLPWRAGRVAARFRRFVVIGVILSVGLLGLAIIQNMATPQVEWQPIANGPFVPTTIKTLALDQKTGTLYAGTLDGMFVLQAGETSWQAANAGLMNLDIQALILDEDSGRLYAGTEKGFSISPDQGMSWQFINTESIGAEILALALDRENSSLYAGTAKGVFLFSNDGGNWRDISTGLASTDVQTLILDTQNTALYAGTDTGISVLRKGATNWENLTTDPPEMDVRVLILNKKDQTLYAGTNSGIFASRNSGMSWEAANAGLTSSQVWALALDERDGTLYAGTSGGIFESQDEGANWAMVNPQLKAVPIYALALNQRDGTLYAGTGEGGVLISQDHGISWQEVCSGLTGIYTQALVLNEQDGAMYAGIWGSGIFVSRDGGENWQAINIGLPNLDVATLHLNETDGALYAGFSNFSANRGSVFVLRNNEVTWQDISGRLRGKDVVSLNIHNGRLYAGTWGDGIFVSSDGGNNWRSTNSGLSNKFVQVLVIDESIDGTLYAGTWGGGVFVSRDSGRNWQPANVGLENQRIQTLVLDKSDSETIFAGTWTNGIFVSRDAGQTWQDISAGLTNKRVQALAIDTQDRILYAGTSNGLFISRNGSTNWKVANTGLSNTNIWTVALSERNGVLYVGTSGSGVFATSNDNYQWQVKSNGLTNTTVAMLDIRDGVVYAATETTNLSLIDGWSSWRTWVKNDGISASYTLGRDWQNLTEHTITPRYSWSEMLFSTQNAYALGRAGEILVYATEPPSHPSPDTSALRPAILSQSPNKRPTALVAWGSSISRAKAPTEYPSIPLAWLALRTLVMRLMIFIKPYAHWLAIGVFAILAAALAFDYVNLGYPFGLSLWTFWLARGHMEYHIHPEKLNVTWNEWQKSIHSELLHYGDVIPDDLQSIPMPLRRYALRKYAQEHEGTQALESRSNRLRLLNSGRIRRWHAAWHAAGQALGNQPGLATEGYVAVDDLATLLIEVLGLIPNLESSRDFGSVYATKVEAPALHLNIPLYFPLVFVADPHPSEQTITTLVDTVSVLREGGYFALVIPLEPLTTEIDVAYSFREAVKRSAHVHDFVVLSSSDALEILTARDPLKALVRIILEQIDLTVVSPFTVTGPTPKNMFFGREAEVKTVVEKASNSDFAIVGNRKIGKTSLLKRAMERMQTRKDIRPVMIDCQTARDAAGFYAAFVAQTEISLPENSPEGFVKAMRALRENGPIPVLVMDEVDALLNTEQARGDTLTSTWRSLAQAEVCHFVFCGATGLANRLDDPRSVFFNFPQALPLGYLSPETARKVITQPLETLGIELEAPEQMLDEIMNLTSGHPNLLQYFGKSLVEAVNERKERTVLVNDLTTICNSQDFTEYYLKTIWGEARSLQKLITLVASAPSFTLNELERALANHNIVPEGHALDAALKLLQVYAILEKHERRYIFIPRVFPEILHRTQEVERLIERERNVWISETAFQPHV